MVSTLFSSTAVALALVALSEAHLGGDHTVHRRLASTATSPGAWFHEGEQHDALSHLFKRGPATDGKTYPDVGSAAWTAAYPALVEAPTGGYATPNTSAMPQSWKDALAAAVAAGKVNKKHALVC